MDRLPAELIHAVSQYLSVKDLKAFRFTCQRVNFLILEKFCSLAHFRFAGTADGTLQLAEISQSNLAPLVKQLVLLNDLTPGKEQFYLPTSRSIARHVNHASTFVKAVERLPSVRSLTIKRTGYSLAPQSFGSESPGVASFLAQLEDLCLEIDGENELDDLVRTTSACRNLHCLTVKNAADERFRRYTWDSSISLYFNSLKRILGNIALPGLQYLVIRDECSLNFDNFAPWLRLQRTTLKCVDLKVNRFNISEISGRILLEYFNSEASCVQFSIETEHQPVLVDRLPQLWHEFSTASSDIDTKRYAIQKSFLNWLNDAMKWKPHWSCLIQEKYTDHAIA